MGDRTSGLVLPLSILVSVAVGAVIGGTFGRMSAAPATSGSLQIGEVKELTDAIHALRLEMEHAREPKGELTAPPPTPAPSRTDAPTEESTFSTEVAKELREATAEFVQAVGELRNAVKRSAPDLPPPRFPHAQSDGAAVSAAAAQTAEEINKSYLFWTYQQVIDAFGAPLGTGREKEGAILWWYAGKTEGSGLNFWFIDGRVFRVEGSS
jgi:hypothetical protein